MAKIAKTHEGKEPEKHPQRPHPAAAPSVFVFLLCFSATLGSVRPGSSGGGRAGSPRGGRAGPGLFVMASPPCPGRRLALGGWGGGGGGAAGAGGGEPDVGGGGRGGSRCARVGGSGRRLPGPRGGTVSVSSGFADGAGAAAGARVRAALPPAGRKPRLSSACGQGRPRAAPRLRSRSLPCTSPPPRPWPRSPPGAGVQPSAGAQ